MIEAVQKVCSLIGKWGCYFLCILHEAEKILCQQLDPFHFYLLAVRGAVMMDTCFVTNAGDFMGMLVGGRWRALKAGDGLDSAGRPYDLPLAYQQKPGEVVIDRWEIAGETDGHFVGSDGWDPYGNSQTVRNGRIVSKRVFRKI
jgi:hypothetical protein